MGIHLQLVTMFQHLDGNVVVGESQVREVRARCTAARSTTGALARRVFGNKQLPRRTNVMVAGGCVVSRAVRFVGARKRAPQGAREQLCSELMLRTRVIVREVQWYVQTGRHVSDA